MNIKDLLSKFGFASILFLLGLVLLIVAASQGQNIKVLLGVGVITLSAALIALSNAGIMKIKIVIPVVVVIMAASVSFAWMDYASIQGNLEFMAEQDRREVKVVEKLKDIRAAQISYKGNYGRYASSFEALISHFNNDSMTVIRANGFVPDTLTEMRAVELGIVTRDTIKIGIRDTLFDIGYNIDSLQYVPFSDGQKFELKAGEIEKNKLKVQVFEAFAGNGKILHGLNLNEFYIEEADGLSVGSMTEPHTRGNWE